jgi:SAM-dependent methyltransferase
MFAEAPDPNKSIAERLGEFRAEYGEDDPTYPALQNLALPIANQISSLQQRYSASIRSEPRGSAKYLDATFWIFNALSTVRRIGLDGSPALRIFDIGTGPGYFPFLCRYYGHAVIAIDIEQPIFEDIASVLNVRRMMLRVEPNVPLASLGQRFSLITAVAPMFNNLPRVDGVQAYWSLAQWKFFLSDLMSNHLDYPGRIYLDLNSEWRGGAWVFNPELIDYCAAHGADVVPERGRIDWWLEQPMLPQQYFHGAS